MKHRLSNNSGMSIIATVMIMMILALFAAAAVSLITTAAGTGIQEERGTQAFYIADGGMQYTLKKNTYPYYAISTSTNLGDGTFTVSVPTLTSTASIGNTSLGVSSTDGFVQAAPPTDTDYWTLICGTAADPIPTVRMSSDCEKISCATKFATCARGKDSTDEAEHISASVVMMYSWDIAKTTTIARDLAKGAKCSNAASRICITANPGFANSGFVRINNATQNNIEDVFYDGIGTTVPECAASCTTNLCLGTNGCTRRAFDGGGNGTTPHPATTTIYQSDFSVITTSTGVITGGILTSYKRVLQSNILMLRDP
jgi:type II secretory pathway pseudopilin PulG